MCQCCSWPAPCPRRTPGAPLNSGLAHPCRTPFEPLSHSWRTPGALRSHPVAHSWLSRCGPPSGDGAIRAGGWPTRSGSTRLTSENAPVRQMSQDGQPAAVLGCRCAWLAEEKSELVGRVPKAHVPRSKRVSSPRGRSGALRALGRRRARRQGPAVVSLSPCGSCSRCSRRAPSCRRTPPRLPGPSAARAAPRDPEHHTRARARGGRRTMDDHVR